jgi:hypothetical protein
MAIAPFETPNQIYSCEKCDRLTDYYVTVNEKGYLVAYCYQHAPK